MGALERDAARKDQSLVLSNVLPAQHDEVYDMHQHRLAILIQGGRSELDQALLRTRL
jgi:hypothetical protein